MARKEHLQNNPLLWVMACCCLTATGIFIGFTTGAGSVKKMTLESVFPDTLLASDPNLHNDNGIYFLDSKTFTGIIKELYPDRKVKCYKSIANGELHGLYKTFYENGSRFEVRHYIGNLAHGRHYGYWPDGRTLKFDYHYDQEKRQGMQKKWYKNGSPYLFANFRNDHEEGLQQGWRENGKLFLNYVAKDGHTYGLQQSALCYTLLNQEIKGRK